MEKVSDRGSAKVAPDEFHYFCRFSDHPAAPVAPGRQARGHPCAAARQEMRFMLRSRILAGSKFVAKQRESRGFPWLGQSNDYLGRVTHL
jgi:hypothetical protein